MQAEEIIEMIIGVCRQHSANCAILFGSRAKGTSTERSDIDIAVTGVKDFSVMQEDLEALPTLFKVDLVELIHLVEHGNILKQHHLMVLER